MAQSNYLYDSVYRVSCIFPCLCCICHFVITWDTTWLRITEHLNSYSICVFWIVHFKWSFSEFLWILIQTCLISPHCDISSSYWSHSDPSLLPQYLRRWRHWSLSDPEAPQGIFPQHYHCPGLRTSSDGHSPRQTHVHQGRPLVCPAHSWTLMSICPVWCPLLRNTYCLDTSVHSGY